MIALWQTTRQAWYRLILLIIILHVVFYGMAILAIAADKQGFCIFFSVVYSVILLVLGLAPDTLGVLIVGSVLWGILPTTGAVANAITVVVKDFVRGVVYLAMVNSFMLFFLGTWNFGRYPGSAAIIIAATLMLGYWGVIYKGDEWFKKIVLWYGVGAIVISLLVSFFPGMVPGKGEQALSRTEQLLDENQDRKLAKKQQDLQERIQKGALTRDQLSKEDREILEETRGFSRSGKAISGAEKALDIATKSEHRILWIIAGLIVLLVVVFRVLKNSKIAAWIVAIAVIAGAGLWIYLEWDSVEKGLWDLKGSANGAISKEIVIDSLKTDSWNDIPSGRYRMEVRGNMYFYKCPGDKGAASGYPEGKTLSGGKDGKIILWSGIARDNPQGNGGEFIVGPQDKVFWKFDTECPNQETVVQQSTVSVNLSPVRLK